MLIKFSCRAHEDIVMFGDVGNRLLGMMGYAGVKSGVIQVDEISAVRSQLQTALNVNPVELDVSNANQDDNEPEVSLKKRAFPLFAMFDVAEENECVITWETT
jgi:hypothetical protein